MGLVTLLSGPPGLGEPLHPDVLAFLDRLTNDDVMELLVDTLLAEGGHLWPERTLARYIDDGVDVYARMPDGVERCIGTYFVDEEAEDVEVNAEIWDIMERVWEAARLVHERMKPTPPASPPRPTPRRLIDLPLPSERPLIGLPMPPRPRRIEL